jgi:hypothetical protein
MAGILRRPGSIRPTKKPQGGMVRWAGENPNREVAPVERQKQLVDGLKKKRVKRRKPMIGLKEPNVGSAVDRRFGRLRKI